MNLKEKEKSETLVFTIALYETCSSMTFLRVEQHDVFHRPTLIIQKEMKRSKKQEARKRKRKMIQ